MTPGQRLAGLKFHVTRLSFEKKTGFPVQVEQYDWPEESDEEKPPLVERYTYSDIKATCGLTDADFDQDSLPTGSKSLPTAETAQQ